MTRYHRQDEKLLKEDERLPGEEVLYISPYKPFSILFITNQRVIGKRVWRIGWNTFEGAVPFDKIVSVKYLPTKFAMLYATVPRIMFQHEREDGRMMTATIHFPGLASRFLGYDPYHPEVAYQLIAERIGGRYRPAG
jgi:hypothetical protein